MPEAAPSADENPPAPPFFKGGTTFRPFSIPPFVKGGLGGFKRIFYVSNVHSVLRTRSG